MRKHFSEYFRATDVEKKAIWGEAAFVFDANVLLNLYRVSRETSLAIMGILKALKGRLFLPHQVGAEFYRHREEEIAKQVNAFESVRKYIKLIPEQFKKQFSRHPCIPIAAIAEALRRCAERQIATVSQSQKQNQLNFLAYDDPVLPELDALFADCSEGPWLAADDDALNKKVEERFQQNLPPCCVSTGGKSSAPPAINPHQGDGRVWFQIVKHAETMKRSIIFVTADGQSNWWRTAKLGSDDRAIGPHFHLIRDVELVSGKSFMMYTQEEFLSEAPKYLDVPEQQQAIEEVKQIRQTASMEKDVSLETGEKGTGTGAMDEDVDPASMEVDDEPKASPLEESKREGKAAPEDEEGL